MILVAVLLLVITVVIGEIALFKAVNFIGLIHEKYGNGLATELSSTEELKNKILETNSNIIKDAKVNSSDKVAVFGKYGTYLFYLENGFVKSNLDKFRFRVGPISRIIGWFKILSKVKIANEINTIFDNISGNAGASADNENSIKTITKKINFANILIVVTILAFIFSVTSAPNNNSELSSNNVYVATIQATNLEDSEYTYKEVLNDFFSNPTWKHFTSEDGNDVVEFTGGCTYGEDNVKVTVQYLITNETDSTLEWKVNYFDIDGEPQDETIFNEMITTAIESYQQ